MPAQTVYVQNEPRNKDACVTRDHKEAEVEAIVSGMRGLEKSMNRNNYL